jgi:CBS domain-containing protein
VFEVSERMIRERRVAFAVAEGSEVVGVVGLEDVKRVPAEERERLTVADVLRRVAPIDATDEAARAMRAFAEAKAPFVPVVENGALAGVLSQADVARALQLRELEATQRPQGPEPSGPRRGWRAEQHA